MHWAALITVVALIEYMVFQGFTGAARGKGDVPAPKVVGDENFERWYRVQMNTVEQFAVFFPALWLCAYFDANTTVLVAGSAFVIGRPLYALGYVSDPSKRTVGFLLGFVANVALILRAGWSAVMTVI